MPYLTTICNITPVVIKSAHSMVQAPRRPTSVCGGLVLQYAAQQVVQQIDYELKQAIVQERFNF